MISIEVHVVLTSWNMYSVKTMNLKHLLKVIFPSLKTLSFYGIYKKIFKQKKGKPRKTEGTVRSSQKIARYENIETQVFLFKKVLDVPFFF